VAVDEFICINLDKVSKFDECTKRQSQMAPKRIICEPIRGLEMLIEGNRQFAILATANINSIHLCTCWGKCNACNNEVAQQHAIEDSYHS
jgi:hypothetical protein